MFVGICTDKYLTWNKHIKRMVVYFPRAKIEANTERVQILWDRARAFIF